MSRGDFFFRATSLLHTYASLLIVFVCFFILFHSFCSHAPVFSETLAHEFPISYSHTELYLIFSYSATTSVQCVYSEKLEIVVH